MSKAPRATAELRFIVQDGEHVHSRPCFSPAGDRVVFMRAPAGEHPAATLGSNASAWSLGTVDLSGGSPDLLFADPTLRATRPDVCPANGKIAFTGVREGRAELWLMDYAGGGLTHVPIGSPPRDELFYACWYADGTRVVVTDYRRRQVLAVDPVSGQAEPLTDPDVVWAGMASMSRDGVLAFAGQPPGATFDPGRNKIWIQLPGEAPTLFDGQQGRMPAWSPDGSLLAVTSSRPRSALAFLKQSLLGRGWGGAVFVADVSSEDGSLVPVTPFDHTAEHAKWSPDGRRIACMARRLRDGISGIALLEL